ncbi:VanZ family protein [Nakamurella sp. A5-74]|uniref:VanZ family protein n=1 Tax=Nakamurella sp. A5-74 TaxID=3158264 RepID=A0AAU8DU02_9ACTN
MSAYADWGALIWLACLTCAAGSIAGVARGLRHGRQVGVRVAAAVFLIGTVAAIVWISLMRGSGYSTTPNLIPMRGIVGELENGNRELGLLNVIGNIVMYLPLGLFAPVAAGGTWWRGLLAGVLLSAVMETLQLALGVGAPDIDDLILNSLGSAAGAALSIAVNHVANPRRELKMSPQRTRHP